jgi:hypothetical protein
VPVGGNSKHLFREVVDVLIQPAFEQVGADQALGFDRLEEFVRFLLRPQQCAHAIVFDFLHVASLAQGKSL